MFICHLVILHPSAAQLPLSLRVTPSSLFSNSLANYLLEFAVLTSALYPQGSTLQLTFPSQYTLTPGAIACSIAVWFQTIPNPTCSINGQKLSVSNVINAPFTGIVYGSINFPNLGNPEASRPYSLTLTVESAGTLLATGTASISFDPYPMACQLSSTTSTVGASSNLQLSITAYKSLNTAYTLRISYPARWISEPSIQPVGSSTTSCRIGGVTVGCLNSNQVVQLTSFSTTANNFILEISPLSNPPSVNFNGVFTIVLITNSFTTASCKASLSVSGPASLSSLSLNPSSTVVKASITLTMSFTSYSKYLANDKINIVFPSEFQVNQVTDLQFQSSSVNFWVSNQQISFKLTAAINSATSISLSLVGIINPTTTASFSSISLTVLRQNFAVDSGTFSPYSLSAGTLVVSYNTKDLTANSNNQIQFTFEQPIAADKITIQASSYTIQTCNLFGLDVNAAWNCAISVSDISLTGLSTTILYPPSLRLFLTLTNPPNPGSFPIVIQAMKGSSVVATYTAPLLIQGLVLQSSEASLTFANQNVYNQGSAWIISVALRVAQASTNILVTLPQGYAATVTSASVDSQSFPFTISSNSITINTVGAKGTSAPVVIRLSMPNPPSLAPVKGTSVQFADSSGVMQQSVFLADYSVTNTVPFTSATVSASNLVYLAASTLTFVVVFPNDLVSSVLSFSVYPLSELSSCSVSLAGTKVCRYQGGRIYVFLTANTIPTAGSTAVFSIQTKNPSNAVTLTIQLLQDNFASFRSTVAFPALSTIPISGTAFWSDSSYGSNNNKIKVQLTLSSLFDRVNLVVPAGASATQCQALSLCTIAGSICSCSAFVVLKGFFTFDGVTNPGTINPLSITVTGEFNGATIGSGSISLSQLCSLPCKSCLPSSPSLCLACYSVGSSVTTSFLYFQNNCYVSCPSGSYTSSQTCVRCPSLCLTCNSPTDCTSCLSTAFSSGTTCVTSCNVGFYGASGTCNSCPSRCSACSTLNICSVCQTSYSLYNNDCISACPSRFTSVAQVCIGCPSNCQTCSSSDVCTSCVNNYWMDQSGCYLNCITQLYEKDTATGTCRACTSPCLTCTSTTTNCLSCLVGSLLGSQCLNPCPDGTFTNAINSCQSCSPNCLLCSSQFNGCTSCQQPYSLYRGNCYATCTQGFASVSSVCTPCSNNCLTCLTSASYCLACQAGFLLHNNACVSSCPVTVPLLFAVDSTCVNCVSPCSTCQNSPANCLSCISGYFYLANRCHSNCPTFFYNSGLLCSACTTPCLACADLTTCLSCRNGLFAYQGNCLPQCPVSLFNFEGGCQPCSSKCTRCYSRPVDCISCVAGLMFNPRTKLCSTVCQAGYYNSNSLCLACDKPCRSCFTNSPSCLNCVNGYYLLGVVCYKVCPSGYFGNSQNNLCQACPVTCLTCQNYGCLTCKPDYSLYEGLCLKTCPANAPTSADGVCSDCVGVSNCLKCNSFTKCAICKPGLKQFNGECLTKCSIGTIDMITYCRQTTESQYLRLANKIRSNYTVPFCYLIVVLLWIGALGLQRLFNKSTNVLECSLPMVGLIETAALLNFISNSWASGGLAFYLGLGSVASLVSLNIGSFLAAKYTFYMDPSFNKRSQQSPYFQKATRLAALFINFKIQFVLISKLMNLRVFSLPLRTVHNLRLQNVLLATSCLLFSGMFAAGAYFSMTGIFTQALKTNLFALQIMALESVSFTISLSAIFRDQRLYYEEWEGVSGSNSTIRSLARLIPDEEELGLKEVRSQPDRYVEPMYDNLLQTKSMFDTLQYQCPLVSPNQIRKALEQGQFRRQNLKRVEKDCLKEKEKKKKKKKNAKAKAKPKGGKKKGGQLDRLLYIPSTSIGISQEKSKEKEEFKIPRKIQRGKLKQYNPQNYIKFNVKQPSAAQSDDVLSDFNKREIQHAQAILADNTFYNLMDPSDRDSRQSKSTERPIFSWRRNKIAPMVFQDFY